MSSRVVHGYELIERLDRGEGHTQVWEARHVDTGMRVAIKVIPLDSSDEGTLDAVMEEVRLLGKFNHKNIVHLKTVFRERDRLHVVMQYVEGSNLTRVLHQFNWSNLDNVIALGIQMCQALTHLHDQKVCHCDVKPANILIANAFWSDEYDRDEAVKLTDFGIAEIIRRKQPTLLSARTGAGDASELHGSSIRGSPAYMAPERFRGEPGTPQSDIWSAGIVLYEVLTGKHPFNGDDVYAIERAVARGLRTPLPSQLPFLLRDVVERCLRVNPEDRFDSARDLMEHLARISVGPVDTADGPPGKHVGEEHQHKIDTSRTRTGSPDSDPWPVGRRVALFVTVLAVLVALGVGLVWLANNLSAATQ
ncbi:MAG: serine/threonine-protein kinase [Phycisphaerae bacterium]